MALFGVVKTSDLDRNRQEFERYYHNLSFFIEKDSAYEKHLVDMYNLSATELDVFELKNRKRSTIASSFSSNLDIQDIQQKVLDNLNRTSFINTSPSNDDNASIKSDYTTSMKESFIFSEKSNASGKFKNK